MINRKQETGMAIIAAVVILMFLLFTMGSCSSQRVVEERVYVFDTVTVHHTDTIRDIRLQTVHDTLMQREVHTTTINNVGDTLKEVHNYYNTSRTIIVDSTDRYKAVVDSLKKIIDSQQRQVVEPRKSWPSALEKLVAAIIIIVVTVAILRRK